MARPIKRGLDYFPLDTNYYEDEKLSDLMLEHGYLGEIVYIRILALVYKNGYYLEMSITNLARLIRRSFFGRTKPPNLDVFEKVIKNLGEYGLLDKELLKEDVITGAGIQKQYLASTNRRKDNNYQKYVLIDIDDINDIDSVTKEIAVVNRRYENSEVIIMNKPNKHFITQSLIDAKFIEETDLNIIKYNDLFIELINEFNYDLVLSAANYIVKYYKKNDDLILDKFGFFRKAIINNCENLSRQNERGNMTYEQWLDELEKMV